MNDDAANYLPLAKTCSPPLWARRQRPRMRGQVVGPPRGDMSGIGPASMLVGPEDPYERVFYGYVRIDEESAQRIAEVGGGWVEIGFVTPILMPWSAAVYADKRLAVTGAEAAPGDQ